MAEPQNSHLRDAEIEVLSWTRDSNGSPETRATPPYEDSAEDKHLWEHVVQCEKCQRLIQMKEDERKELRSLLLSGPAHRQASCPEENVWIKVAGTRLAPTEADALINHAATCAYCGHLLRKAVRDLDENADAEERSFFSQPADRLPPDESTIARRLAAMQITPPLHRDQSAVRISRPRLHWWWAWAAVILVVAIAGGTWLWIQNNPGIDRLLAKAYSENRTLELRFAGAPYAALHKERGQSAGHLPPRGALLQAEAEIERNLAAHPDDARWIEARGRAELLAWDYEAAIQSFHRALELRPNTAELQADLATAYFERAEDLGRETDYASAIELFGKALEQRPNDPVLLFNRAIANEQMFLYRKAADDWRQFLAVEPKGPWADEAQHHLDELKKKSSK